MKKLLVLLLSTFLVGAFAVGCTTQEKSSPGPAAPEEKNTETDVTLKDGVYFAQEDAFAEKSGYKYFVVLTVEGGKITDADWSATNVQATGSKRTLSENGEYGMEAVAKAGAWHDQAVAAEKWLIENQDPSKITYTDDEGHTDALTTDAGATATIKVGEFFELAQKALEAGPVAQGTYTTPKDYVATATIPVDKGDAKYDPNNAWEYRLDLIIVNGTIMDSNLNAVFAGEFNDETAKFYKADKDGNPDQNAPLGKVELGLDYGMDWKGNAEKVNAFVIENQGFDINYTDDKGHTDTITGVSIHVNEYEDLFKSATNK